LTDETDSLIARKLMDHPWGFYASEAYIQARGLPQTFEEMQGHDVILLSDAEFVDCVRKAQGRLPEGKRGLRTNSLTAMVGLLAADEGVGFLPRAAGDPEPTLRFCFTEPDLVQPLWLVTSQEAYATPLIRTFMGFLNQSGVDPFAHIPENWRN
ncbi:MAG: substrate-binding domain-containing protein, partial [Pseudomonadota bacterium]